MNTPSQTASAEEQAATLINGTIKATEEKGGTTSTELARNIEKDAKENNVESPYVYQYVAAVRESSHGEVINVLPEGVGGQFDGSTREIATSTMEVGSPGVSQTIAQMKEVKAHELYHAVNEHTAAMNTYEGSGTVIIGDQEMGVVEVIEGVTVSKTGNQFVSEEYRGFERMVESAAASADMSVDQVAEALKKHDLSTIDDRERKSTLPDRKTTVGA